MRRVAMNGWFYDQPQVGSGQYVRNLWRALGARADVACTLVLPRGGDVTVPLRPWGSLAKVWWEAVDLPRAVAPAADILHYPYFAAPLATRSPVVVTIHDLIPLLFPEYSASPQAKLYNAFIAAAARRAAAIIAVSEHTRQDIIAHLGIPAQRIHVTYEAVTAEFCPQPSAVVAAVRQRYALERYVFYIGGLNRHKNVTTLLAAYARARRRLPLPCPLVIAGRAHSANTAVFPDLRAEAAALGLTWSDGAAASSADVRFLGFVAEEDKPALYSGAAAFVYPSSYEGFGFCPLEAMACGAPVICSRAASLPEICGDGALLLDPRDAPALADAISDVVNDATLAADLRRHGLAQAARFSWADTAARSAAVYHSL